MHLFLSEYYLWIKALHLISVISWLAGLLYLPRLFIYHADADPGSELAETLQIMERRLLKIIMNPAMVLTWLFGIAMIMAAPDIMKQGWMHAKFTAVICLTGFHHVLGRWRKKFLLDQNNKKASFYRKINEIPTILMMIIIVMVVVKPF